MEGEKTVQCLQIFAQIVCYKWSKSQRCAPAKQNAADTGDRRKGLLLNHSEFI